MTIPTGHLQTRKVVTDLGGILADLLDSAHTGYLRLAAEDALLVDGGATVLTFEDGVPVAATHTETDRAGADALADAAVANLYRIECYDLSADTLAEVSWHTDERARIPPELPAEQLAGDNDLAARTRERTPATRATDHDAPCDAVLSFLDDESAIEKIRSHAREEARERAKSWGIDVDTGR